MSDILELPDDVWSVVLHILAPLDVFSISQTCSHLHDLSNPNKHFAMNKYWQYRCQQQWRQVNHKCTKRNDYSCGIAEKNYNFYHLFQLIVQFVFKMEEKRVLGYHRVLGVRDTANYLPIDKSSTKHEQEEKQKKEEKFAKCFTSIVNMDLTMNDLKSFKHRNRLSDIIAQDNVELFKIWLCNMSSKNDNFTINTPVRRLKSDREGGSYNQSVNKKYILSVIVTDGATKIAQFVLGPKLVHDRDGKPDIDSNINSNINSYNFANIDLSISNSDGLTVLILACSYKENEIVSLLINHPNMTKKLINDHESHPYGFTPLHCALSEYSGPGKNSFERRIKIVEMLVKDKRTNVNGMDEIRGQTPLMMVVELASVYAIAYMFTLMQSDRCDVNIQNRDGNTALHILVLRKYCSVEVVKAMLTFKDLDVNIKNRRDATALDLAKQNGASREIITMLEKSQVEKS